MRLIMLSFFKMSNHEFDRALLRAIHALNGFPSDFNVCVRGDCYAVIKRNSKASVDAKQRL